MHAAGGRMAAWHLLWVWRGKAKHASSSSSFYSNLPHTCSHTNTCSIFSSSCFWFVSSKGRDWSKRAGASFLGPLPLLPPEQVEAARLPGTCKDVTKSHRKGCGLKKNLMNVDVTSEGHLGATMHFLILSVISCGALSCGGLKAGWREVKTFLILCEIPLAQICRRWITRVLCDSTHADMHFIMHTCPFHHSHKQKSDTQHSVTLFQQIPFNGLPVVAPLPVLPLHHLLHHSVFSPDLYVGAVH